MSFFNSITQNVITDNNNSTSANILSGATWSGTSTSTLGIAGIQINIKTDQNCSVYLDQSMDGNNWDITDTYDYFYSLGGNSWTAHATASYLRLRVKNTGTSATTYCRIQTNLCPIVEAIPRSLDDRGHLKIHSQGMSDEYGFELEYTPMGEMRTAIPYRLVGTNFEETILDPNFWTSATLSGSSVNVAQSQVVLSAGISANGNVYIQTVRSGRYVAGTSNRFRAVIRLPDTGITNNVRRWGAFTSATGAFFELSGTSFSVVTRKSGVDNKITNGNFNGDFGNIITVDTNVHTYEIYWTNSKVYFINSNGLIHTFTANTATWSDTLSLPVRLENYNINNSNTNTSLNIRAATVYRLGSIQTQTISKYITGTTTGQVLKYGAGNLHGLIIGASPTTGSVITIYDGTSTGGNILASFTITYPGGGNFTPTSFDFKNLPFFTGLFVVIATQSSSITVIYE